MCSLALCTLMLREERTTIVTCVHPCVVHERKAFLDCMYKCRGIHLLCIRYVIDIKSLYRWYQSVRFILYPDGGEG